MEVRRCQQPSNDSTSLRGLRHFEGLIGHPYPPKSFINTYHGLGWILDGWIRRPMHRAKGGAARGVKACPRESGWVRLATPVIGIF